ncbi:segregation/condensation protein B [Clostridium sp. MSJ-4]|uniref:Segregation and condensation protein B n=1 Tax=Clostridium simiarum TaxID=2841506 RepID=A0ABS6EWX7_9CLOT|nr:MULTISPECIES: SMC-Scp complex subunit ScpB [Clostridium]MBU5590734.1 segregation/condensation protein B [Clostridium simiarum]
MKDMDFNQVEFEETSKKNLYTSVIESLLFVSGEPMELKHISNIIECDNKYTKEILKEMIKEYEKERRGIKLIHTDGKYQLVTKPENSDYIQKILKTNSRQSLSQAALETLAIIAYKQPITRIDIDEIRGVKSDSAVQRLLERELIKESGRLEVAGRPILYSTTEEFLKQFNMETLKELPSLDSFIQEDIAGEVAFTNEETNL